MRTTLTLEPDVAAMLEQFQRDRKISFKDLINQVLRLGMDGLRARQAKEGTFRTRSVDLGPCLLGNVDDVAEALEWAEGDKPL